MKPILFSPPMVRAILAGQKTQTRRVVKPQPRWIPLLDGPALSNYDAWPKDDSCLTWDDIIAKPEYYAKCGHCPYGGVGDRLWVREAWATDHSDLETVRAAHEDVMSGIGYGPYYKADTVHEHTGLTWRPSIFMPRWASRISLEIVDVRVERVQDITEADAEAEGCRAYTWTQYGVPAATEPASHAYAALWDSINGKRAPWESNPWVWVVSFLVARAPQGEANQ